MGESCVGDWGSRERVHDLRRPLKLGEPNLKRKEEIGGIFASMEASLSRPGVNSSFKVVN